MSVPTRAHLGGLRRDLAARGHLEIEVAGGSMEPTLARGEQVRITSAPPRIGDVVLFEGKDDLILHRVIAAAPRIPYFVHAGDAPGAQARIAKTSAIIGRADVSWRRPTRAQTRSAITRLARSAVRRLLGLSR